MLTLSRSAGSGGSIGPSPDDFTVREITPNGTVLMEGREYSCSDLGEKEEEGGRFAKFVLQKRGWDTTYALIRIAKELGRGKKSIGYCGTKDRSSVSVQLASVFGAAPEQVKSLRIKDLSINGAWRSATPAEMGANIGNSFSVSITGCTDASAIGRTAEELGSMMPNYYDRQRFGMRMNNFGIGVSILRNDFKAAALRFLTDDRMERNAESSEARRKLAADMDFKAALDYFPKSLRGERMVIEYLSRYDNYANALRKLPRGILLMFVHSVQSLIFNASLEERIRRKDFESGLRCGANFYGFPDAARPAGDVWFPMCSLPGYATKPEDVDEYEAGFMEKAGISASDFKVAGMPELGMKGSARALLAPVKDLRHSYEGNSARIGFSIPAGSYATVLVNEITKSDDIKIADLAGAQAQS